MSPKVVPDIQRLVQLIDETVSQDINDNTRIMSYLRECDQLGVEVLPLDINVSKTSCSIEDENNIRIGFSLLVSGNEQFIEDILAERQQNGPFRSFQEFCERIDLDSVPEGFITRCIQVGAFDSIEPSRSRLFLGREKVIQVVRKVNVEKSAGQISLFTVLQTSPESQTPPIDLPEAEEWTEDEVIAHEKEAAGFSFHEYFFQREDENSLESGFSEEVEKSEPGTQREPATPVDEEPPPPSPEFTADEIESSFPQRIEPEEIATVTSPEEDSSESSIVEETKTTPPTFIVQLSAPKTTEQTLLQLREIVRKYPGDSRVILEIIDDKNIKTHIRAHAEYSVQISEDLVEELEAMIGEKTTRVQD